MDSYMYMEIGSEYDNYVEFVVWSGNYSVSQVVRVARWEWEAWGKPRRVRVSVSPA